MILRTFSHVYHHSVQVGKTLKTGESSLITIFPLSRSICHFWLYSSYRAVNGMSPEQPIAPHLSRVLQFLNANPSVHVSNPVGCSKRASVALIIRVKPAFQHKAEWNPERLNSSSTSFNECIDGFFDQDWVQKGEPEVLFNKRASRSGDRWTSHVAFPGGGREPQDPEDISTSMRETREETGLNLETDWCLRVSNLPERVITTAWGKKPYASSPNLHVTRYNAHIS